MTFLFSNILFALQSLPPSIIHVQHLIMMIIIMIMIAMIMIVTIVHGTFFKSHFQTSRNILFFPSLRHARSCYQIDLRVRVVRIFPHTGKGRGDGRNGRFYEVPHLQYCTYSRTPLDISHIHESIFFFF